jgi:ABC-type sugar transport system permease subunit
MPPAVATAEADEGRRRRLADGSLAGSAAGPHVARRRRLFWPFVLPAMGLYVLFLVLPTIATVALSTTEWAGIGSPRFVGLRTYREMFASEAFQYGFLNTLIYVLAGGAGTFAVAFLFAMVLREVRASRLIRAILFFPNIVAPVALGMFLGFVFKFQPDKQGLANFVLESFGADAVKFLRPENVTWVAMAALVWASAGFYITILMAAVDRIPPYLYEDAHLAGASPGCCGPSWRCASSSWSSSCPDRARTRRRTGPGLSASTSSTARSPRRGPRSTGWPAPAR